MTSFYSNVLGGNFALVASPSVGASGAIFGTVAVGTMSYILLSVLNVSYQVAWIDLFAHWEFQDRPVRKVRTPII